MSNFELLHPALRHHIVNSLGWKELRPFQDESIPAVLSGNHAIIIAPTAGGKTESAVLPILSRMLATPWSGLSVLYICPMKALINDLGIRLERYLNLVGRRAAVWHGDVSRSKKDRMLQEPPDLLITTPESLEAMLVSTRSGRHEFFAGIQSVIIDEIHLFAGDDRGWHLMAVLARLKRLAGREFQRIGLSATVGNPEFLAEWLSGDHALDVNVLVPREAQIADSDIQIDYVGSLENAAIVISRLYRGQKRLVFVDSRSRAEQLANLLHELDVRTFVTHSSLSREERSRAELAFQSDDNCVIVATSVLEVGVDVGDLDRVIQIDAPNTVSSFLQRMGRTGRRSGTKRNCLFLATSDEALIRAAGIVRLFKAGYLESIRPPAEPFHILAQQVLALCLQESGVGSVEWFDWVREVPAFSAMDREDVSDMLNWMLNEGILFEDQGILGVGRKGEQLYGRQNYLELLSVFLSPPIFSVQHGSSELGSVDERAVLSMDRKLESVILLGGQSWQLKHMDWSRRRLYVEPSAIKGATKWMGIASGLDYRLCQAIKETLILGSHAEYLSQRAAQRLSLIQAECPWLSSMDHIYVVRGRTTAWWTFGGSTMNSSIGHVLRTKFSIPASCDDFKITFADSCTHADAERAIAQVSKCSCKEFHLGLDEEALNGLKFSNILPVTLAVRALKSRLGDVSSIEPLLKSDTVYVSIT